MIIRCNDPRCLASGKACTVATIEDGKLVIVAKHRGDRHVSTIPLDTLNRAPVVLSTQY